MSYSVKGAACVRCKAYLFDEDEVVVCPICGAPHHRDCYDAIGHCALEELHGTENQYDIASAKKEAEAKVKENSSYQAPPKSNFNNDTFSGRYSENQYQQNRYNNPPYGANPFMNFDFLGGVPNDYELAENVTADDAKNFVISNTHRYIPKFASFNSKKKASWNWLAFLFPVPWLFCRKMYSLGFLTGFFKIVSTLLSFPLAAKLSQLGVMNTASYPQMLRELYSIIPTLSKELILITLASSLLNIAIMVVTGIWGDYWYKKHTISAVQVIKRDSNNQNEDYRKKGGVNIFWFYLAYMGLQIVPNIIITLI